MQVEAKEGAKPLAAKPPIAGVVEVHCPSSNGLRQMG